VQRRLVYKDKPNLESKVHWNRLTAALATEAAAKVPASSQPSFIVAVEKAACQDQLNRKIEGPGSSSEAR